MIKKTLPLFSLFLAGLFWLVISLPVSAHAPEQGIVIHTPTAMPDGRILYKVQENDTCLSISLLMGIPLDKLRQLNNLKGTSDACIIQTGQNLLLGKLDVTPSTPTVGPSPTPTPLLPTPTQFNGTAQVCILLYGDLDGNAMRDKGENALADGAVSLTDRLGKVSLTLKTVAGDQPVCFNTVPEGDYNISVAVPEGYNPTTTMNYALTVKAGDKSVVGFGAQQNSQAAPPPPSEGGHSPLLGILGGVLLLGGVGLGVYVRRGGH